MLAFTRVHYHFEQTFLDLVFSNYLVKECLECGALVQFEITELTLIMHHITFVALSFQVAVFFTYMIVPVFPKNVFGCELLMTHLGYSSIHPAW